MKVETQQEKVERSRRSPILVFIFSGKYLDRVRVWIENYLAKITLTIAKKVAIDKLSLTEKELPLDTLDQNIICEDALFYPWIKADAIDIPNGIYFFRLTKNG